MGGMRSIYRNTYKKRLRETLLMPPNELSSRFDPYADVDYDIARVMATSNARSPAGVKRLMREHNVKDVHSLMPLLPYRGYPRRFWQRVHGLVRWAFGWYGYDPVIREYKKRINRLGIDLTQYEVDAPQTARRRRRVKHERLEEHE